MRTTNKKTQVRVPLGEKRTKRIHENSRGGRWRPAFWSFTIFSERRKNVHEKDITNWSFKLLASYANKSTENSHKKKHTRISDKTWGVPKFHLIKETQIYTNLPPNQVSDWKSDSLLMTSHDGWPILSQTKSNNRES